MALVINANKQPYRQQFLCRYQFAYCLVGRPVWLEKIKYRNILTQAVLKVSLKFNVEVENIQISGYGIRFEVYLKAENNLRNILNVFGLHLARELNERAPELKLKRMVSRGSLSSIWEHPYYIATLPFAREDVHEYLGETEDSD